MANANEQIHVSAEEARAGATPGVARYVLGTSLAIIIVIFALILLWGRL